MTIQALLLDLDDTLLQTHEGHMAAMDRAVGVAVEAAGGDAGAIRMTAERVARERESELERGDLQVADQPAYRALVWREALAELNLPVEAGEAAAAAYLDERRRHYRLYDEAPEALERLGRRYRLLLVTNGLADFQREKIVACEVQRWAPDVVVSGELGIWKPQPGIFEHALGLAGCPPGAAMMVGDSLEKDIAGAGRAGLRTAWMRRYEHLSPRDDIRPDLTVESLCALEERLYELESSSSSSIF